MFCFPYTHSHPSPAADVSFLLLLALEALASEPLQRSHLELVIVHFQQLKLNIKPVPNVPPVVVDVSPVRWVRIKGGEHLYLHSPPTRSSTRSDALAGH